MKLKIKSDSLHSLDITIRIKTKQHPNKRGYDTAKEKVPHHLIHRIQNTKTMTELMQLLFSTTHKTERVLKAFDAQIDALELKEQTLSHHSSKLNNNGSPFPTNAA